MINLQDLLDQQVGRNGAYVKSDEAKASISAKNSGRTFTAEHRAKISQAKLGTKLTQQTKDKMRQAHLGVRTPGMTGQKHTDETLAKMRASALARRRQVMTPHGIFAAVADVAQAANVNISAVYRWIKVYPEHYYFLEKCGEQA